jgi:hypothetical protein
MRLTNCARVIRVCVADWDFPLLISSAPVVEDWLRTRPVLDGSVVDELILAGAAVVASQWPARWRPSRRTPGELLGVDEYGAKGDLRASRLVGSIQLPLGPLQFPGVPSYLCGLPIGGALVVTT